MTDEKREDSGCHYMVATYNAYFYRDDGHVTVLFPDIKGCVTTGKNLEDAIRQAKEVLATHIGFLLESGKSPPLSSPFLKPDMMDDGIMRMAFMTNLQITSSKMETSMDTVPNEAFRFVK